MRNPRYHVIKSIGEKCFAIVDAILIAIVKGVNFITADLQIRKVHFAIAIQIRHPLTLGDFRRVMSLNPALFFRNAAECHILLKQET